MVSSTFSIVAIIVCFRPSSITHLFGPERKIFDMPFRLFILVGYGYIIVRGPLGILVVMLLQDEKSSQLVSIREIKEAYRLSYYTLYGLIKSDPTFPCINIGPKKNYRNQRDLFAHWLKERLKERHHATFQIPSAEELYTSTRSRETL